MTEAHFREVDFRPIPPNTKPANLQAAKPLSEAVFENVIGLSKPQINLGKDKGSHFRSRAFSSESAPVDNAEEQTRNNNMGGPTPA